jgi:hypothetical protein
MAGAMSVHRFYPTPYAERVELAGKPSAALLRWDDADRSEDRDKVGAYWGFEHVCKTWPDDQEPDGEFVKVVAPRLTNHTVMRTKAGMTVRASILCSDCGLHGFVTDSRWEAA